MNNIHNANKTKSAVTVLIKCLPGKKLGEEIFNQSILINSYPNILEIKKLIDATKNNDDAYLCQIESCYLTNFVNNLKDRYQNKIQVQILKDLTEK
ncbi:hypothetical protein KKE34_02775 [Patescibacteria group bacterium]|nr:hypothetical protein [Patescibacteria group bacterium]MBU1885513.1 hypothetical protein [Patescibacteria group bacterium]